MMLDRDLFAFLEHTTDAAFAVTDGGEICSWNASAEVLFGFSRDEVVGKTCFDLLQGRDVLGAQTCTDSCHVRDCAAHHAPIPAFDLEVKTRSGQAIWVNVSTIVHEDPKSGRRRIVHLARRVEDRKRAEAVIQQMLALSKQLLEISDHSVQPAPVTPLSGGEHRVLRRFSKGQTPAAIADELKISPQTIRNHLYHINLKLGTHSRLEAVTHAIRRKLI